MPLSSRAHSVLHHVLYIAPPPGTLFSTADVAGTAGTACWYCAPTTGTACCYCAPKSRLKLAACVCKWQHRTRFCSTCSTSPGSHVS
eukprot:3043115-Rhodomonas_salina.1